MCVLQLTETLNDIGTWCYLSPYYKSMICKEKTIQYHLGCL